MSSDKIRDNELPSELEISNPDPELSSVAAGEVANIAESSTTTKSKATTKSSERQIKFERAQKCLENAALVTKRIKEHRKATAELLGRPFEEDDPGDTASELASNVSERTSYSVTTDTSTTLSVQDALNIPGISESLANTLKQKELLMEKIKQYKEITKKPMVKKTTTTLKRAPSADTNIVPEKLITDSDNLQRIVKEKENSISVMQVKMKAMETTIMDLQEKIGEKDMVIDAKTKATSLMSDNLSRKEKDSMNLLEDTRQQMTKMQENFVAMEIEWKEEKTRLVKQLEERDDKIKHLEEANTILENSRFEISVENSKINQELEEKTKEILELQRKINELAKTPDVDLEDSQVQEKGSIEISNMVELSKRIELLEQINCQIRQTNKELENKLTSAEAKPSVGTSPKKASQSSPLLSRKGRNSAAKSKSPWSNLSESSNVETGKKQNKEDVTKLEMVVQSLNKDIIEKEYIISQKDERILQLQNLVLEKENLLQSLKSDIYEKESNVAPPDTHEIDTELVGKDHSSVEEQVLSDQACSSNVNESELKLEEAFKQIAQLTKEIDAANKNMIKVKSNHKIKLKQMQKTIDSFSKVSDANAEVTKLNDEVHQLTQKIAELEEEKGNLQLHLVDYDSGRLTESETYKKLVEVESLAENRLKVISTLETQKFDLVQELHLLQQKNEELEDKLADMSNLQSEHVCSEIQTVQLEEQLDNLIAEKKEIELIKENLRLDKEQMSDLIKKLETDKLELTNKLENLIQENIDLTEKLEKLSAEKVSSAESIEIVESLTTQQKLEIEEYNKGVVAAKDKQERQIEECKVGEHEFNENMQKYIDESVELNRKIELFTFERQEVMEKMNAINTENELLQNQILQLSGKAGKLQDEIEVLNNEKHHLQSLNVDLNNQIEQLKQERIEIMKETSTMSRPPSNVEEATENIVLEVHSDDKSSNEKSGKGTKTVKQLTKDILKLKNIIKEREAEIADCQMKILSLEEQQQKYTDIIEVNESYESKLKALAEEKRMLSEELNSIKQNKITEDRLSTDMNELKQTNDKLALELNAIHNEYNATIQTRDLRITELEKVLIDYEQQIYNYNNTLQIKDKEMTEYMNQVTKLNDVSQKLKSTIECLEEEKARDQNAELVKSLNKQINIYQKSLKEYEEKLSQLEEEKSKLLSIKAMLETKNVTIENELKILKEALLENQKIVQDSHLQQQKYSDDISAVNLQVKERDEEIHEIKLQLRKESIENEKLRNELSEKEKILENESKKVEEANVKLSELNAEKNSTSTLESKNNELMEKLKKFAVALKKKTAMCSELEVQLNELKKDVKLKNEEFANNSKKIEDITNYQERITILEDELKNRQAEMIVQEQQKVNEIHQLQETNKELEALLFISKEDLHKMTDVLNLIKLDLRKAVEENTNLKTQVDMSNGKLIELQHELKDNSEFTTKISALETNISQRDSQISHLLSQLETLEQNYNQMVYGQDAKLQERDLYIENLETEILKYKSRIARLEESISVMEDRRHSLERKADQLDVQLQEKYKAYNEYSNQEDELINRLAVLMDHDRVVEKQLHEIEKDNKDLQIKIQDVNEDNVKLRKTISDIHKQYDVLVEKANKTDTMEVQINSYQENIRELENMIKRITSEHQSIIMSKTKDIEDIEVEFNTQIENMIKEKKILLEKYEKMNEHVALLEQKVNEYKTTNNNLSINLEELSRLNQELYERLNVVNPVPKTDYTDQYIEEINKLNGVINLKDQEITHISENLKQTQANNSHMIFNQQTEINSLNNKITEYSIKLTQLTEELENLKGYNVNLQKELHESEERVKCLNEKKIVTFEMNIPKTEGMLISSTIEELSATPSLNPVDIASIESQIVGDTTDSTAHVKKEEIEAQVKRAIGEIADGSIETQIVPQKAYLCYKNTEEQNTLETVDPFNSDDGWGFDNSGAASGQLMADLSRLNEQILDLKKSNEKLQTNLSSANTKLLKAMKKIKELKANNDVMSNELRLSKQLSQPAFLDSTLEDELRVQVQDLNKTLEELSTKLNSENRENETLRKQNEQLGLTNTKLLNQKEKLDNEIELWKYKFRESNDKLSSMQWESEPKQESVPVQSNIAHNKDELIQLEKENDELQNEIEDLTRQNKELAMALGKLKDEITCLKETCTKECSSCSKLQDIKVQLEIKNDKLNTEIKSHMSKLQEIESQNINDKQVYEENVKRCEIKFAELNEKLKEDLILANEQITRLKAELSNTIEKLDLAEANNKSLEAPNDNIDFEMFESLKKNYEMAQAELLDANNLKLALENEKDELTKKIQTYELQSEEIKQKMQQLNGENDRLLSTVAELRNSVSTAVDQRGYEIAEMWKQHLSQRESDFGQIEKELKEQLNSAELKYEQLLDRVQSSSQEETNTLVMMEQCTVLQNKLKDTEEQVVSLKSKCADLVHEMEMLRSDFDDEKTLHESKVMSMQDEFEKQLAELNSQQKDANTYNEQITKLQSELILIKEENNEKDTLIEELNIKFVDTDVRISELVNQITAKDKEIFEKTRDYNLVLAQRNEQFETVRLQLVEYEKKLEDVTHEKESELATMRLKMHENLIYYEDKAKELDNERVALAESLHTKTEECLNLNKELNELRSYLQENADKMTEMQTVLETQEYEIVTLKDEIVNLEEIMKSTNKMEKRVTFASDTKPGPDDSTISDIAENLLESVPKAELDLALYMLHQRDVRCEELTMELTQLLEERDTLQLRLSDSIRSNEDLKVKCKLAGFDITSVSSQETIPEGASVSSEKEQPFVDVHKSQTSRSSSVSEGDPDKPRLQAKLTELRSVKHSRDVRLRNESEQREMSMRLLQRDVANLPPEAAEQLRQAHHTLSRDTQSTSTVLLNWLRGKSTPKVVHM